MDRGHSGSGLTKLAFGVLACNSVLAVCKSWGGQYAELFKMGFSVVACNSPLAHHHAARAGAGFLTLTWLFLRRFDGRARGAGQ
jgi:hypothetical protein